MRNTAVVLDAKGIRNDTVGAWDVVREEQTDGHSDVVMHVL